MARTSFAERLYRLLLRCYPGEFRDDYEREMMLAFRERLSHDRGVGTGAVLRLWMQLVVDSIFRAPGEHLDVLRQDLRYGFRSLRRAPLFTFTAIATLALGVGANTAIFSVVYAVALQPLPYEAADRLVRIWERNDGLSITGFSVSLPNFMSWRERTQTLELSGWRGGAVTLRSNNSDPVRVPSVAITPEFFGIMKAAPVAGRTLVPADAAGGAERVAVIRDSLWRSYFGGDPRALGSTVTVGPDTYTIVGVVAQESVPLAAEFYYPLRDDPAAQPQQRSNHVASVLGRIKPGYSFQQAQQEMESIARQLAVEYPDSNKGWGIEMSTVYDWIVPEETRQALFVLLAAVGCVLLIACANVANLMLARAASRKREVAVRMAIGAARRRLVRQVLTEGLLLAGLGGAMGILVAYWTVPLLREWLPTNLPRADETTVNSTVLLFSLGVCVVTGLAFAILPALASSKGDLIGVIKDGTRGTSTGGTRSRQILAAAQVALATVLLVGAGLMVQSLMRLQHVPLGFEPARITTAQMGLTPNRFKEAGQAWSGFYQGLLEKLAASPGVQATAMSSGAPFGGGNTGMPIKPVGESLLGTSPLQTDWRMVSPRYFKAMGIPLLRGRDFVESGTNDVNTIIASETMARRMWGDADPIGRQIEAGPNGKFTVVGLVGDVRNLDLSLTPAPTMYLSAVRFVWPTMTIIVRADERAQPSALIRRTVKEIDPQLAVFNIREMTDLIDQSAAQPRLNASLIALFALIAALLAALGIYGVLAYLVSQRSQEIGIRMALGAGRSAVLRLFLARGLWLASAGLVLGVLGSIAIARWIGSLLFEVRARDPWTIAAAALAVAAVALLASYIPARRATRVDPLIALRAE